MGIASCSSELAAQTPSEVLTLHSKIKALERDLYYYKKTSRDLKQQLHSSRTLGEHGSTQQPLQDSLDGGQ